MNVVETEKESPFMQGTFVTVEGPDGAGKSTHLRRFSVELEAAGHPVVLTREPGGTRGAEEIRKLIVEPREWGEWTPEVEMLLFKAARRDHLESLIRPALAAGKLVLSDRFADSTRVYQGATRGDLRQLVDTLHELVIGAEPDLTVIIDVDPDVVARRIATRASTDAAAAAEDRFERLGTEFQHKLRAGYLRIAEEFPERCVVVDGHGSEEEVYQVFRATLLERLGDCIRT